MQNPVTAIGAGIKTKCCKEQGVLLLKEIREYQALIKLLLSRISEYKFIQEVTEDVRTTRNSLIHLDIYMMWLKQSIKHCRHI